MKIAARNSERSRADEKLISGLKTKALECQVDLEKSEASLEKIRAQWAKKAEERAQFVQQMKRNYGGTITSLRRKVTTLENKAAMQAKDFKADREHCYDLMAQMEEEIQHLQNQHLHDSQVLEARKTEKPPKNPEQEEMIRKVKSLEQSLRNMQGLGGQLGMLNPIEPKLPNPPPRNLDHSVSCEYCSGAPGHDTEKCWKLKTAIQELIDTNRIEVQGPEAPKINQNPLPANHETNMIEVIHKGGEPKKPSQIVMMIRSSEVKPSEKSTSGKPVIQLKGTDNKPSVVVEKGSSSIVAVKPEKVKVVVPGITNTPVVVVEGARIEPVIIKSVTQLPIVNSKAVPWNYKRVAVTYKGKEVREEVCEAHGLTRSRRCFAPEELRKARIPKDNPVLVKKAVNEEEAEEFLRKMKVQDYSIVEQLRKMPAQISLLSLLIHSDEHRRALMKILNEDHVPDKMSVNHLEKIANKIFEVNKVTFSDDELPVEGTEHNRALYLTVKYEDSVVTRVLIDNGSSANICPLSTLEKLKVDNERIHKNSICVRGSYGGGKDSVGDIVLELTIGPVEFTMEFQVLDVAVSYNLLLGRPWIHAAKEVSSTLHQMVKFEWDKQEVVVHDEDNLCALSDAIVLFIKVEDDKGPWVYQVFDTVSVEKIPEGKSIPVPKVTAASVMVASKMLKNGFVPGKGLGASLQAADIRRARKLKQRAWVLPKPVRRLSRSFVRPGTKKRLVTTMPGSVVGPDKELLENLFDDVNMVEAGEGSSKADVQFVGPSAKINNWEATPLPTRREFW
ncbi:PREDICTED: uncharacterized protein LOC109217219 [Nicotiana attenuata]|uniref:uncharacterized protein LOC109217219 n=1 Tax=Nicotiana attenuata TaxID=49451 RepID=UPI000905A8FE|nr:PREDICTED: uncharacterized protein LOC109217219 [Nicotiana attenuata]